MKLLLDTCVWGGVRKILKDSGNDVIWAGDWPEDPGDEEILARAYGFPSPLLSACHLPRGGPLGP